MQTDPSRPKFERGLPESTGVLVVNLGTPEAPTTGAVRRFLRQFLSDPRVINYPRWLWLPILNLVILVIRPPRSAAAYRKIWTEKGSPLLIFSQAIADKLRQRFGAGVSVELGMSYGKPSIADALQKLLKSGAKRIITLPLYPQFSTTTTASVADAVQNELATRSPDTDSRFIDNYHDAAGYIEALAASVLEYWDASGRGDKLLMSFHGVPKSTLVNGDPYETHCRETARLLARHLNLADDEWLLTFQSRVGREEWLSPYTEETITDLGQQGLSRLDVVCPGFAADCLETLEEIAMQNAEIFTSAGGGALHYVPALNDRSNHIEFLAELVESQIDEANVLAVAS